MCLLSWKAFLKQAEEFVNISDKYDDGWNLFKKGDEEGNAYLVVRRKVKINVAADIEDEADTSAITTDSIPQDLNSLSRTECVEEVFDIEYHVAFSLSYQVPVLYFRGHESDGRPIDLDDAWKIFRNPFNEEKNRGEMLSILTQCDHPILFTPFLSLHPCRTAEILSQKGTGRNEIVTFLSIMGPFVGLSLRNEYGLEFKDAKDHSTLLNAD